MRGSRGVEEATRASSVWMVGVKLGGGWDGGEEGVVSSAAMRARAAESEEGEGSSSMSGGWSVGRRMGWMGLRGGLTGEGFVVSWDGHFWWWLLV